MLKIIAGLICMFFLCSCSAVSATGAENLLVAPKINKRQAQVSEALESTLSLRNIIYKYPQGGDYRSPFVFFDLNGDGNEEAIVFYNYSGEETDNVRAKILKQDLSGNWSPFYDITLQSGQIEFVEFQKLLSTDSYCLLTGLQGTGRNPATLAVYSMRESSFPLEAEHQYYNYTIRDFNGDGLAEIAIITRDRTENTLYLSILQKNGSLIEPVSRIGLSRDVDSVNMLTYGKLWDGTGALYIDETLADGGLVPTTATEVIRVGPSGLKLLVGGEAGTHSNTEDNTARNNYEVTFRDESIYCMDVDGDGIVEVPYPMSLPGAYEDMGETAPKLIQLMHLKEEGFDIHRSAVINVEAGYMLYMPKQWENEAVTVENRADTSEWRFRKWNGETQEPTEELLRIQAVIAKDNPERFDNYIELGTKGMTSYMAYIPRLGAEALAITEREARDLFSILPDS